MLFKHAFQVAAFRTTAWQHGYEMRAACPCLALSLVLLTANLVPAADAETPTTRFLTNVWDRELSGKEEQLFKNLPAPINHYESLSQAQADSHLRQDANYAE